MKIAFRLSAKERLPLGMVAITIVFILVISCQKIVQIDLNSSSPKLVIEGVITDSAGPFRVMLTKSGSYFNQPVLPPVSGAFITISDNAGIIDTLKELMPGIYFTSKIKGMPGQSYSLKVISENTEYDASTSMMSHVNIDSLVVEKSVGLGGKENRRLTCYFNDPRAEKNYYRLKMYTNGKTSAENYHLYDDQYTDGETIGMRSGGAQIGDTDVVVLESIDKKAYDYYRTLEDIIRTNPFFGSTPANPNSNLSNGALGYFAAFTVSNKAFIVSR